MIATPVRPLRGAATKTAILVEIAANQGCTPRPFESNSGTVLLRQISALARPAIRDVGRVLSARKIQSAATDAIHRTAAIPGRSRRADPGGHHRARDGPWTKHHTRPHGAANRVVDILAVDHGTNLFRTSCYEASDKQRG